MNREEIEHLIKNDKDLPEEAKELLSSMLSDLTSGLSHDEIEKRMSDKFSNIAGVDLKETNILEVNTAMMASLANAELEGWEKQVNFKRTRDESRTKLIYKAKMSLLQYMEQLHFLNYQKHNGFYMGKELKGAHYLMMDFLSYFMQLIQTQSKVASDVDVIKILRTKNGKDTIEEEGIFKLTKVDEMLLMFSVDTDAHKDINKHRRKVYNLILCFIVDQVQNTLGQDFFKWLREDYYVHQAWRIGKISGEIKGDYEETADLNNPTVKKLVNEIRQMIDEKLKG